MIDSQNYKFELNRYVDENNLILATFTESTFLVSGAAGLIGSYLIDLLIAASRNLGLGIKVFACDRNKDLLDKRFPDFYGDVVTKIYSDICVDELPKMKYDYIIHAASNTSPVDYATKPIDTIWTNVLGAKKLLDMAVECCAKRFLFCSSVEAYGRNNGDVDEFNEAYSGFVDCNTVRAGYPSAKRCVEALCNAYAAEHSTFDFVTARIGRYFGPTVIHGDTKAPSQFIGNAIRHEDIILKSAGTQLFSWGYVGDCATALLLLLVKGQRGGAYNVADPKPYMLKEFAQFVADSVGVNLRFIEQSEVEKAAYSKVDKATMNVSKLQDLGWSPMYSIAEGVKRTVSYLETLNG